MTITTLEDLLVEQVRDLYDAEKQLVRALPKMAEAARSQDLGQAGIAEESVEEDGGSRKSTQSGTSSRRAARG